MVLAHFRGRPVPEIARKTRFIADSDRFDDYIRSVRESVGSLLERGDIKSLAAALEVLDYGSKYTERQDVAAVVLDHYEGKLMPEGIADTVKDMAEYFRYKNYAWSVGNNIDYYLKPARIDRLGDVLDLVRDNLENIGENKVARAVLEHYRGRRLPKKIASTVKHMSYKFDYIEYQKSLPKGLREPQF
jgi:hypothetical protein